MKIYIVLIVIGEQISILVHTDRIAAYRTAVEFCLLHEVTSGNPDPLQDLYEAGMLAEALGAFQDAHPEIRIEVLPSELWTGRDEEQRKHRVGCS